MDTSTVIGSVVILVSTGIYLGLYVWSCRRINTIADKQLHSLRSIMKEFRDGRGHED